MDEEITAKAVNAAKQRGVETSGSTARSDVRERSEGNPSPTTIYKIKGCCECNGLHDRGCGQKSMLELIQYNEDKSARLDYEKRRKVITALL